MNLKLDDMSAEAIMAAIAKRVINGANRVISTPNFVPSNNAFVRSEQAKQIYHRVR